MLEEKNEMMRQFSYCILNSSNTKKQFYSSVLSQSQRRRRANLTALHQAVDCCAQQMFGVELMSNGMWSDKGQDGEMKFKVLKGTAVPVWGKVGPTRNAKTFSVYNDATSYNFSVMGSLGFGGGGGISKGIYEYYEERVKKYIFTNRNYTASDADTSSPATPNGVMQLISYFKSIQIHETGNSLSKIIGKYHTAGNWTDPISGITYYFGATGGYPPSNPLHQDQVDYDTGQAFELNSMLKYRQILGIK